MYAQMRPHQDDSQDLPTSSNFQNDSRIQQRSEISYDSQYPGYIS